MSMTWRALLGCPYVTGGGEGGGGILDFLRDNPQFQAIRAMVQGNPQILQPMLAELQRQARPLHATHRLTS